MKYIDYHREKKMYPMPGYANTNTSSTLEKSCFIDSNRIPVVVLKPKSEKEKESK